MRSKKWLNKARDQIKFDGAPPTADYVGECIAAKEGEEFIEHEQFEAIYRLSELAGEAMGNYEDEEGDAFALGDIAKDIVDMGVYLWALANAETRKDEWR